MIKGAIYEPEVDLNIQKEAEEYVLTCALVDNTPPVKQIIECLPSKLFYFSTNRTIWKAIREAHKTSPLIDTILVSQVLQKHKSDVDAYALVVLAGRMTSSANINHHATYMVEQYMRTQIRKVNLNSNEALYSRFEDVLSCFDQQQSKLKKLYEECFTLVKKINGGYSSSVIDVLNDEFNAMERDIDSGTVTGIPYGIPGMDGKVDLMVPGDMIVIASRPSMGKTIMAIQIALHAALVLNKKVDFHSLEMTKSKLAQRIIAMYTAFTTNDILYRKASKEQVREARNIIKARFNDNLQLYDDVNINIDKIGSEATKSNAEMILLDYLQLVSDDSKDGKVFREAEVSAISRGVKKTAMALKVPFIALSQLNREVEKRVATQFKPQLSDLRESGSIEQDADTIIFPYRPWYYKLKDDKYPENITQMIVAKQRNGSKPVVPALFDPKTNQFIPYENNNENEESSDTSKYNGEDDAF